MKVARAACVTALVLAAVASGGEERQVAILTRAFGYVYGFKQKAGDAVTLAVLYKGGTSGSESCADGWASGFKTVDKVVGLPFSVVKHAYESPEKLKGLVTDKG